MPVPPLESEAQRVPDVRGEVEPLRQHVGDLAARGEVVHRPFPGPGVDRLDHPISFFGGPAGGGERHHVAHDFSGIGGVVDQRLGANGDLVAEKGRHLVGVARAAQVTEQGDPVDGGAQISVEAHLLAQTISEQA